MKSKEQIKYEKAHRKHAHDTAEQLRGAYNRFIYDITQDINVDEWIEDDYLLMRQVPRFEARYKAKERVFVKQLLSIYLGAMTVASLRAERKNASLIKNDKLRVKQYNKATNKKPTLKSSLLTLNSPKRLATARVGGLSLSERVWKNCKQTRAMIEVSLNVGIKKGMSREAMARAIVKHLQHPDTLHSLIGKRYRGKVPMQVLQHFHPGQGVYRDPYKNAYRLAISEVNNAYRQRDYELGQQNPYLIGWKIQRSQGRRATTCDLCKDLEGVYPKSFLFQGWHSACLCYAIQVLADNPKNVRPITKMPKAYSERYLSKDSTRKPYTEQPSIDMDSIKKRREKRYLQTLKQG